MSPFEVYDIHHLSPSSCNTFIASPAMFVLQKCLKRSTSVGPAAHRGTSVESGIAHGLVNPLASLADCVAITQAEFSKLTSLMPADAKIDKEAAGLAGMVEQGLNELRPYGVPTGLQGAISYDVEGLAVPLIGYYDFLWEDKGVLVDLKTTHALPSKISINHARQVSLYRAALGDNLSARITYATSKKVATYELENPREHLEVLAKVGRAIQRFLSISSDPMELASLVVPDVDSFYFNDPITRQAAFDVWGI